MVHRCCISSCKMNVRVAEAKGLSYHCFPLKDPHREKWIQAILPHVDRPESFKIVQGYTRVCSRHFRIKEYSMDSKKRARLNSSAVPSVFPRKNAPLVVQSPIEAAKSQIVNKVKNASIVVTNSGTSEDQLEKTTTNVQSVQIKDDSCEKNLLVESATSSNDQMILNLLNSVSVEAVCGLIEQADGAQSQPDEANSDVSNDDKQDQTKRKRRKWNRTAFARNSKSKQKKASSSLSGVLDESALDEDTLGDMSLSTFLDLTRSNSLDLESELTVNNNDRSLGLNVIPRGNRVNRSSLSCLPVSDSIQVEDLNLVSIEEQELLQSIQAVSLDCGEADMNLNLKNIHIGSTELESAENLTSQLLSAPAQKSLLENPILLEDALISSASEMSLQSSKQRHYKVAANSLPPTTSMRTPSASEIEKLARDLRSSLLTSSIDLNLDVDELRLPVGEFSNHTPIIGLPENLLISKTKVLDKDLKACRDDAAIRDQASAPKQSNKSASKKGTVPRKKLVGITKKPKNSDKYFGKFSVERFCDSDKDIEYYTGFPTYSHFEAFFNSLESHVEKLKVTDIMHGVADLIRNQQQLETQTPNGSLSKEEHGTASRDAADEQKRRPITGRSLSRIDELFMTLVRLKRRLPEKVLGHMFYVSQPTVSRIIRAWTVLLSKLLEPIPSTCETSTLPDGPKSRQSSSKTNGEHNYFTNKGIYIPDSFRQLFLSDVAVAIISSAHNPRLSSSNSTVGNGNAKILVNNNNEEPSINNPATNINRPYADNSRSVSSSNRCNCKYPCSCTTTAAASTADDCRVSFPESSIVSPCGEVEIDSNDFYHWGLLVNE